MENKVFEREDEVIQLKINELNINGEGVGFLKENTKVCVKNVLPNETVKAKVVFKKNNFIKAKLLEVVNSNKNRVEAKCPYFGSCGGCDYQQLKNVDALKLKKEIFENYFSDVYNKGIYFVDNNSPFEYRNKASFIVKNNKVGFQQEGSNNLVEIDNCCILKPEINKSLNIFKKWLNKTKVNNINHFVVRVLNKNLMLTIVCSSFVKEINFFVEELKKCFEEDSFGVYLNFNTSKDKILSDKWKHIYGLKILKDNFEGISYNVHPNSFMQVNDEIRNILYKSVQNEIKNEVVIEGYSGAGLLSGILCKTAKEVIGVEINKNATENANKLKEENNLDNLQNINGDCKNVLPVLAKKYKNSVFVVDPPRSGCDQNTLQSIIENNISKVVYVSCNPYTLKQNIKFLSNYYDLEKITMFNMFPNTSEIETLAVLIKK